MQGSEVLNEWDSKQWLKGADVAIPQARWLPWERLSAARDVVGDIEFPVVAKLISNQIPHKTEVGGVCLNLNTPEQVEDAIASMVDALQNSGVDVIPDGVMVESMVRDVVCELLVGVRRDSQFGQVMVIASGGVLVELLDDAQTLVLPTDQRKVLRALKRLRCFPLLGGFRGRAPADIDQVVSAISGIARLVEKHAAEVVEMDINPLMVQTHKVTVADALVRLKGGFASSD